MPAHLSFLYKRLSEKLWIRPLFFSLLAVLATIGASAADSMGFGNLLPRIDHDIVDKLLSIIAASMLGVATFAVGSMVSAYASVSSSATPRAFALVVSDDVSKTALSTFIAAFIFSVIALVAIKVGFYGRAGLFFIFVATIAILGWVVLTFVRWVDQIARLGRVGSTIERVERAARSALEKRRQLPYLGAMPAGDALDRGEPIYADVIGYVQHIDVDSLQNCAMKHDLIITVAALPGTFVGPGRALIHLAPRDGPLSDKDRQIMAKAFFIARDRTFEEDPRFGLVVLSEIAARALSPGINDPGTAINIIGAFVRLFALWVAPPDRSEEKVDVKYDRVRVAPLQLADMFDDAFTAISRDGAGTVEVVTRLQKAFVALATISNPALEAAARHHSALALARAELSLKLPSEIAPIRELSASLR